MDESEKAILAQLLKKRKQELQNDLDTHSYSETESIQYSKENQIDCIDTLLVQL
jgi:hypothetical protein